MRTVFLCMELKIVYSFCFVWQIILFEQHRRQDLPLYILKWLPNLPRQVPLSQQQTNWRIYRVEVETRMCIRVKPEVWLLSGLLFPLRLRGTLLGSSWKLCGRGGGGGGGGRKEPCTYWPPWWRLETNNELVSSFLDVTLQHGIKWDCEWLGHYAIDNEITEQI